MENVLREKFPAVNTNPSIGKDRHSTFRISNLVCRVTVHRDHEPPLWHEFNTEKTFLFDLTRHLTVVASQPRWRFKLRHRFVGYNKIISANHHLPQRG